MAKLFHYKTKDVQETQLYILALVKRSNIPSPIEAARTGSRLIVSSYGSKPKRRPFDGSCGLTTQTHYGLLRALWYDCKLECRRQGVTIIIINLLSCLQRWGSKYAALTIQRDYTYVYIVTLLAATFNLCRITEDTYVLVQWMSPFNFILNRNKQRRRKGISQYTLLLLTWS